MPFELLVALRFLRENRMQNALILADEPSGNHTHDHGSACLVVTREFGNVFCRTRAQRTDLHKPVSVGPGRVVQLQQVACWIIGC